MNAERVGLSVVERRPRWDDAGATARSVLDVLTSTPWGAPSRWSRDQGDWHPIDSVGGDTSDEALDRLAAAARGRSWTIEVAGDRWRGSIGYNRFQGIATFGLEPSYSADDLAGLRTTLVRLAVALPHTTFANARIGGDPLELHRDRELPLLPAAFNDALAWAQVLPPATVAEIGRDVLAAAPVERVEFVGPDGEHIDTDADDDDDADADADADASDQGAWALVQTFADPADHDTDETHDRLEQATRHLLAALAGEA